MVSDLLRHFQLAAVLQIRRDAGRAEGMIPNPRFDAGRFRPPADDAVGVLPEEGIGGKLAGLATGAAEEIAVDVIGDAGRFDVIMQTLIGDDDDRERRAPCRLFRVSAPNGGAPGQNSHQSSSE